MRYWLRVFTVSSLLLLVLMGSGRITIGRMICLGSGYTSYSIGNAKDCCGEKSPCAEDISQGCCDLRNISFKLPEFNISEKLKILVCKISFPLPQFSFFNLSFLIVHSNCSAIFFTPKEYLHFIYRLLI